MCACQGRETGERCRIVLYNIREITIRCILWSSVLNLLFGWCTFFGPLRWCEPGKINLKPCRSSRLATHQRNARSVSIFEGTLSPALSLKLFQIVQGHVYLILCQFRDADCSFTAQCPTSDVSSKKAREWQLLDELSKSLPLNCF